jgi:hypothetical protein
MREKFNNLINQLEDKILYHNKLDTTISASSIGWHIEHSLKVLMAITNALYASEPKDYKRNFKMLWLFICLLNRIPRGKGNAPKSVMPEGQISIDSLQKSIEMTRHTLNKLDYLSMEAFFIHPYFGSLRLKSAIRFMEIHTMHHLKIIHEIEKGGKYFSN